jgi:hypothetical protein
MRRMSKALAPGFLDKYRSYDSVRGYSYTLAFSASHGEIDSEVAASPLAKWISGNRKFFTGGRCLEDRARVVNTRVLSHAFFFCGFYYSSSTFVRSGNRYFDPMLDAAKMDMRLMCLDDGRTSLGWADHRARLHDEVFLIPGCYRPVVLRKFHEGRYKVVGDAVVLEARDGTMRSDNTGGSERNMMTVEVV